jgi:DNA-binding XRE family transcriptional regulator
MSVPKQTLAGEADVLVNRGKMLTKTSSITTLREQRLMSKAELAQVAGVALLTINLIEQGRTCRSQTLHKIIRALGYALADKERICPDVAVFSTRNYSA